MTAILADGQKGASEMMKVQLERPKPKPRLERAMDKLDGILGD
jgi:hypothetical protein